jgi:hypothetical protein
MEEYRRLADVKCGSQDLLNYRRSDGLKSLIARIHPGPHNDF